MRIERRLIGFLFAVTIFTLSCGKRVPTLNLLVWEGYSDSSFIRAFEQQNHCRISASYMGSSDELVAKLRGGSAGNYDVISPSSDVATSIATAGLAAPLDLSKIPSYGQLSPQLTSLPLVRANGQVYGVPFMWGPDPMLYDTTVFAQPPESWTIFWDPKYRGKISVWDDLSTVYMAAQILGYDQQAAGTEAEYSQAVVHRRRANQSISKSRNRRRHGLDADNQSIAQAQLSRRRNHPQRKHHRMD